MSYRKDLREAELAVIGSVRTFLKFYDEYRPAQGTDLLRMALDNMRLTLEGVDDLRSQLDAAASPHSDHDTSQTAAHMMVPHAGSLRRSILVELHRRRNYPIPGATDDALERALKRAHTSVSAARNFLVNTGWVSDSGQRIDTSSGRPAVVWVLAWGAADRVVEAIATEGTPDA